MHVTSRAALQMSEDEDDDDDMVGPLPIEKLVETDIINVSDVKKLMSQGMFTIESVSLMRSWNE